MMDDLARHLEPSTEQTSTELMPRWTWEELERALIGFAVSEAQVDMVAPLVSATRKQAPFYSKDLLLREILAITYVIGDESFLRECGEGPDMT
jgi:hypothetical protein